MSNKNLTPKQIKELEKKVQQSKTDNKIVKK